MPASIVRYAVVFRTHFWDAFVERQFWRLKAQVQEGDVFVLVDETRGVVPGIITDRVYRLTDEKILAAGFVAAGSGSLQWYSGDVPLYMFQADHPGYDFYVHIEYDVILNVNLDDVIRRIACDGADVVALSKGPPTEKWMWLSTCLDVYARSDVRHQLICLSVFSDSALHSLRQARLEHADRYRAGKIQRWPYCEGFVPTETARQGLNARELSDYGDVSEYNFWPPHIEGDLRRLIGRDFVHPVLDTMKYEESLLKINAGLRAVIWPFSWYHRKLRRLGLGSYLRIVAHRSFRDVIVRAFKRQVQAAF